MATASTDKVRYLLRAITSMHSCFFRFGSPRRRSRQALDGGGGGGVTVVSRGGEGAKQVVVSRGELERIAAGVTRRQCGGGAAGAAPSRRRHIVTAAAVSLEGQVARATPRSEPDEAAGVARRGGGDDHWRPALDGIPEEA